jgi:hypothetical protein
LRFTSQSVARFLFFLQGDAEATDSGCLENKQRSLRHKLNYERYKTWLDHFTSSVQSQSQVSGYFISLQVECQVIKFGTQIILESKSCDSSPQLWCRDRPMTTSTVFDYMFILYREQLRKTNNHKPELHLFYHS